MSWWDSAHGFTNLASAALKTAQKRIDKVLDIKEEEDGSTNYTPQTTELEESTSPPQNNEPGGDTFFENWLGGDAGGMAGMFLSPKSEPQSPNAASPSSTTLGPSAATLSLKDKLEKKRAARAAKKSASTVVATKITSNEKTIDGEKKVQTLGSHPQSAFTAVKNEVSQSLQDSTVGDSSVDTGVPNATAAAGNQEEPMVESETDITEISSCTQEDNAKVSNEAPSGLEASTKPADESTLDKARESQEFLLTSSVTKLTETSESLKVDETEGSMSDVHKENLQVSNLETETEEDKIASVDIVHQTEHEVKSEDQISEPLEEGHSDTCSTKGESDSNENVDNSKLPIIDNSFKEDTGFCKETDRDTVDALQQAVVLEPSQNLNLQGGVDLSLSQMTQGSGSGWDDVSLSILSESQMSNKETSAAQNSHSMKAQKGKIEVPEAEVHEVEHVEAEGEGWEEGKLEGSWDNTALESSTATDGSLEVVTKDQVVGEAELCQPSQLQTEPEMVESMGGDWSNEGMNISLELEAQQNEDVKEETAETKEGDTVEVQPESAKDEVSLMAEQTSAEQEYLTDTVSKDKSMEESLSNSETMDELSESNRTLTGEEIEQSRNLVDVKGHEEEESRDQEEHEMKDDQATEKEEGTNDVTATEENSKNSSPQSQFSSSSYVKNMLEEAMVESVKDTDSHTDSHSSSDMVRIESGQNSGHTSADEIDTTTSSDIEIISHISTPTPNGDGLRMDRPFDLSPLRHALSRSVRRGSPPGHKRSDSSSSGQSFQSRNGDELLSPDNLHHRLGDHDHDRPEGRKDSSGQEDMGMNPYSFIPAHSEASEQQNNPLETEKLLKESKGPTLQPIDENSEHSTTSASCVDPLATPSLHTLSEDDLPRFPDANDLKASIDNRDLAKKLAEVSEVLDAREKKLVTLSQENMSLVEANTILRSQLQQAEEAREAEMEDLNTLSEEFTQRIGEMERTLQTSLREKEAVKKKLQEAELEIVKRSDNTATERVLKEKEQIIAELLEEGEKLSKQQLQGNNIIKKLRTKKKKVPTATLR